MSRNTIFLMSQVKKKKKNDTNIVAVTPEGMTEHEAQSKKDGELEEVM